MGKSTPKLANQNRTAQLNQYVSRLLESGLWGTLYEDLATCYKVLNLTVPKSFTLSTKNEEDAGDLARRINDKRIQVKADPEGNEGKLVITAVWK